MNDSRASNILWLLMPVDGVTLHNFVKSLLIVWTRSSMVCIFCSKNFCFVFWPTPGIFPTSDFFVLLFSNSVFSSAPKWLLFLSNSMLVRVSLCTGINTLKKIW